MSGFDRRRDLVSRRDIAPASSGRSSERRYSADSRAPRQARDFAAGMLGAADPRCGDVVLVVSELASNAVLHARTAFSVRLTVDPIGRFRIEVRDGSRDEPTVKRFSAGAVTGRGVGIVELCSDRWGVDVDGDGKAVWCEFDPRLDGHDTPSDHE